MQGAADLRDVILGRLTIQEWHAFRHVDVDFSRLHVASVIGRVSSAPERSNGAGKSYLIEAPLYAVFGYDRDPSATQRLGAQDDTFVEQWFHHRGREARIKRGFKRKKDGTPGEGFLEFDLDGQRQGKSVRESNVEIIKFFGCGLDLYLATCFFSQGTADQFVRTTPAQRKEVLADLLGMMVYEVARVIAEKEAAKFRGVIDAQGSAREQERVHWDQSAQSAKTLESKGLVAALARVDEAIAVLEALRDDGPDSLAGLRALAGDIPVRAKAVEDARAQVLALKQRVEDAFFAWEAAGRRRDARREVLAEEYRDRMGRIRGIPERQAMLDALNQEVAAKRAEVAALVVEDSRPLIEVAQAATGRAAVAHADAKRAADSITALDNLQALCPACGQSVPETHRALHRATFLEARREAGERLTAAAREATEANAKVETIRAASERLRVLREALAGREAALILATDRLKDDREAEAQNAVKVGAAKAELEGFDSEIARLKAVQDSETANLNGWTISIGEVEAAYRLAIDACDQDAEKCVLRLVTAVKDRLTNARTERDEIVRDQETLRGLVGKIDGHYRRMLELEGVVATAVFELGVRTFLGNAFSRSGIPMLVMENVVSEIERGTVEILEAMESQFRVKFKTETGTGRDTIQIEVETPDGVRGLKSFSGGQVTEINLAVRLALSEVLSRRAEVSFDSVFLDEVMGALDAPARQCFLRVVNLVRRSFSQVFVISHHEEIKNVLESAVVVTWTPEGSVVEVSE